MDRCGSSIWQPKTKLGRRIYDCENQEETLGQKLNRFRIFGFNNCSRADFAGAMWFSSRQSIDKIEKAKKAAELPTDSLVRIALFFSAPELRRARRENKELISEIREEVSAELSARRAGFLSAAKELNSRRRLAYRAASEDKRMQRLKEE